MNVTGWLLFRSRMSWRTVSRILNGLLALSRFLSLADGKSACNNQKSKYG
jgi:hypothetical protein